MCLYARQHECVYVFEDFPFNKSVLLSIDSSYYLRDLKEVLVV